MSEFAVSNFRGIRTSRLTDLGDINLIVGKNGSGKSSLLEAMILSSAIIPVASNDALPNPIWAGEGKAAWVASRRNSNLRGTRVTEVADLGMVTVPTYPDEFWFRNSSSEEMIIELVLEKTPEQRTSTFATRARFRTGKMELHPRGLEGSKAISEAERRYLSSLMFLDSGLVANNEIEQNLWENVLMTGAKSRLISLFNKAYKSFQLTSVDYSPSSRRLIVSKSDADFGVPLDSLGAGMRIAFRLFLATMQLRNTMLLIEEIDAFQHPESLAELLTGLVELARLNQLQIFMTTHRESTIDLVMKAVSEKSDLEGRLVPISLSPDGALISRSIPFQKAIDHMKAGYDFRRFEDYIAE